MAKQRDTYIAPLIEEIMPNATVDERHAAQAHLWSLFDAIYAVTERLEREQRFPLTDDKFR